MKNPPHPLRACRRHRSRYNGLRPAGDLAEREGVEIKFFCFGDAVGPRWPADDFPTASTTSTACSAPAAGHGAEVVRNLHGRTSGVSPNDIPVPENRRAGETVTSTAISFSLPTGDEVVHVGS